MPLVLCYGNVQFVKLFLLEERGCVEHYVAAGIVFRECYAVAYAVEPCKERYPAVEAVSQSAVGRCAVFEGVHEETELLLRAFGREAEHLENLGLQLAVVNTY